MTARSTSLFALGRWKPIAVLVAVFLCGGVTGVAVGRVTALRDLQEKFRGPPFEGRAQFRLEAMRRRLDLTDAQVRALETIMTESEAERDKLLDGCRPGLDALRERTEARIKEVLTPEQRAHYEEFGAMGKRRRGPPPAGAPPFSPGLRDPGPRGSGSPGGPSGPGE